MDDFPKPEWVKLIPADSIPVFCFPIHVTDQDWVHICTELERFFGKGRVLAIRGDDVQITALAATPACICGGEPHASHCPANRDPFLRGPL